MNSLEAVLNWADNLIFNQTGKHLTPTEEAILKGSWEEKKYSEIAEELHCSESDVKKKAAKLWKKLREDLGEDLKKSNFIYKLKKKYRVDRVSHFVECVQVGNINICNESPKNIKNTQTRSQSPPDTPHNKNKSPIINLKDAPKLTDNSHRESEISTLKQWILETKIRLITIYGLSGIGKSILARELIQEIQTEFDYIFWKNLHHIPPLSTLKTDLKQFFSQSQTTPLSTIIDYFRAYRCLVILDDVENIFESGQLAGNYLPEYKDYSKFLKEIATVSHQSCLILISWEKPREIAILETQNQPIRTLNLQGLEKEEATKILTGKELTDEEKWSELISIYQGNPTWLNIIAATIKEDFHGRVSQFLAEQEDIYLGDLEPILESHFERLSPSEKKVTYWLASQNEPVNISQRPANFELSKSEFLEAIRSLCRRSLVEKKELENQSIFHLNPVFKQYIVTKHR